MIKIAYTEDAKKRLTTYKKRRMSVVKKAMELSILCGSEISLIIMDKSGECLNFSSAGDSRATLEKLEGLDQQPPVIKKEYVCLCISLMIV